MNMYLDITRSFKLKDDILERHGANLQRFDNNAGVPSPMRGVSLALSADLSTWWKCL